MSKKRIAKEELEHLILQLLKDRPQCTEAQTVSVDLVEEDLQVGNWRISQFNPGNSSRDICEAALWDIEDELLPGYELAD